MVYTINGIHPYKLLVKATITPVMIRMSRADLNFRFLEDSLEKTLSEKLVLENPGNAPAKFSALLLYVAEIEDLCNKI